MRRSHRALGGPGIAQLCHRLGRYLRLGRRQQGISGSWNGATVIYRKTIVCRDITLHRPYIGLIIYIYICGRYLQFRFLKWPLKNWLRRSGVLEYGKLEIPIINIDGILVGNSWNLREFYSKPCLIREELLGGQRFLGVKLSTNRADGGGPWQSQLVSMFPKERERKREYAIFEFVHLRVKESSGRANWLVTFKLWNQSGRLPPSPILAWFIEGGNLSCSTCGKCTCTVRGPSSASYELIYNPMNLQKKLSQTTFMLAVNHPSREPTLCRCQAPEKSN